MGNETCGGCAHCAKRHDEPLVKSYVRYLPKICMVDGRHVEDGWGCSHLSWFAPRTGPGDLQAVLDDVDGFTFSDLVKDMIKELVYRAFDAGFHAQHITEEGGQATLAERRQAAGLSQRRLAEESGVHFRTIQGWEYGDIGSARVAYLKKVADVLGCGLEDLYPGEDAPDTGCKGE